MSRCPVGPGAGPRGHGDAAPPGRCRTYGHRRHTLLTTLSGACAIRCCCWRRAARPRTRVRPGRSRRSIGIQRSGRHLRLGRVQSGCRTLSCFCRRTPRPPHLRRPRVRLGRWVICADQYHPPGRHPWPHGDPADLRRPWLTAFSALLALRSGGPDLGGEGVCRIGEGEPGRRRTGRAQPTAEPDGDRHGVHGDGADRSRSRR